MTDSFFGHLVRVRDALADDAAAIAAVHVASWRAAYVGLLPDIVLDGLSVAQRARHWRHVLAPDSGDRVVVAESDGQLLGFAQVGPATDADAGLDRLAGDGCDRAVLWMLSTNARAAQFYEREGWLREEKIRVQQFGGAVVIDHRYTRALLDCTA